MEIIKKKVTLKFSKEEMDTIEKVIDILAQIEGQEDEIIDQLENQFDEYRHPCNADNPTAIAIDYLGSLINYGEED